MRRGAAPTTTPPRGRLRVAGSLHLPAHRASSVNLAGAYPFLAGPPSTTGPLVGVDAMTGGPFCFDPWALYTAGELTNPNTVLAGVIGQGKSALAKSLALRAIATGRRVYVPGDPKGEWCAVAEAVGGAVVRLGPGLPTRLNPLDAHDMGTGEAHAPRLRILGALAELTLRRELRPSEHEALEASLAAVEPHPEPTLGEIVDALAVRATADGDGRDLLYALRRLVRGDLAGMFDGTSTQRLDGAAPMTVLDMSGLGSNDDALAVAMACASAWLEHALVSGTAKRWVIYDEAWRLMRSVPLVRRMQAQWKLSRAYGIANLLVLHRLSDLDAVGRAGSEARALAEGLLADCSTRIVYRQESDQLEPTRRALGLSTAERDILTTLPRGTGLWKMPRRSHVVHHHLTASELALFDTDAAMRDQP